MADAVVFLAVVLLAIASFTHSLLKGSLLFLPCQYGFLRIVVFAARALTDTGLARVGSPSTDTVKLATLATFAITVQLGGSLVVGIFRRS